MKPLTINMIPGKIAPKYRQDNGVEPEYKCEDALEHVAINITEKGTEGGLPIVDFVMKAPDGKLYLMVMTGREINAISAVVKAINLRNHQIEEP